MANTLKTVGIVLALGLSVFAIWRTIPVSSGNLGSAPSNMLAENYLPYVMYNGGYNSAKPITTSNTLFASTVSLTAGTGCLQLHATSTATWIKEVFVTTGATSTYNGTVYWGYGTCTS